jgi:hypothetical protein
MSDSEGITIKTIILKLDSTRLDLQRMYNWMRFADPAENASEIAGQLSVARGIGLSLDSLLHAVLRKRGDAPPVTTCEHRIPFDAQPGCRKCAQSTVIE